MMKKGYIATAAVASILAVGGGVTAIRSASSDNDITWRNGEPIVLQTRIGVETKTANDAPIDFYISEMDAPEAWTNTVNVFKIRRDWTRFYTPRSIADYNLGHRGNFGLFESDEVFTNSAWISTAEGSYSFANGINVHAIGAFSHAEGCGVGWQVPKRTIKMENYDYETLLARKVLGIGPRDGSDGDMLYFEKPVLAIGLGTHAEGLGTVASNSYSHAEGAFTLTAAQHSHAEGIRTITRGEGAHSEGVGSELKPLIAFGYGSHAEGASSMATGSVSHAEGSETISAGRGSHSEGAKTVSSGVHSHAEGCATFADGMHSHAEGRGGVAFGSGSHVEGFMGGATGIYSHVEGRACVATGAYSHAEGWMTVAGGTYSHAEGDHSEALGQASSAIGKYCSSVGMGSFALGTRAKAMDDYDFTWSGTGLPYEPARETSGTFNVNPKGGLKGFFIGDQSLYDLLYPATVEMTPVVAKSPRSPSSIRISTVAGGVVRIAGSGSVVVRPSNNVAEGKATLVIEGYSTVKFIGFRISEEPLKIEGEDPVAVFDVFKCGKNVFAIRQY